MYEMTVEEASLAYDGFRRRQLDDWRRCQSLAYLIVQTQSKKKLKPDDILNLEPLENIVYDEVETKSDVEEVTEENKESVTARLREKALMLKNSLKNKGKNK